MQVECHLKIQEWGVEIKEHLAKEELFKFFL
jgi:hypothetical protein